MLVYAQKADTTKVLVQKGDTIKLKKDFLPTGIRVGTDLISIIRSQTDASFSGYEFNAEMDFYRFYLVAEVGKWERKFLTEVEQYNNSGSYARIGVDVNFLLKDPDKNMFFFGLRYGRSMYSENFKVTTEDPVWGTVTTTYTNTDLKAGWGELTTGLRVKMWKFFWLGYTARYKIALNTNETGDLISYDVPGYGKTASKPTWGFNYQILFRIPIRKQK
jgi:hypothetical protein